MTEKENSSKYYMKISPIVRARILFKREFNISNSNKLDHYNEDYFKGLLKQREEIVSQRDNLIKLMFSSALVLALFVGGVDFKLPYIDVLLSSFPAVVYIASVISSLSFLMIAINFVNEQSYAGVIDAYLASKFSSVSVDCETYRAAYIPENLYLRVFRDNFFVDRVYDLVNFDPSRGAKIVNFVCSHLISWFFAFSILLSVLSFAVYVNIYYIDGSIIGWIVRFVNFLMYLSATFIFLTYSFDFTYEDKSMAISNRAVVADNGTSQDQ